MILAFYKPYGALSQFTPDHPGQRTLAEFGFPKGVYAVGRLDHDSEGLLLLTDEKEWNDLLLNPKHGHKRTYHAQVEGQVSKEALQRLQKSVVIQNYKTQPCLARCLEPAPEYPERCPPVRFRKTVPTSWIELKLTEGKNRQVRRMTAAVGFPTLRLIRAAIGDLELGSLQPGQWIEVTRRQMKEQVLGTE